MAKNYKFNSKEFTMSLAKSDFLQNAAFDIASQQLDINKKELVKDFESHPVTIEIDNGPDAANSSGTLGGYGNLFSFIGFKEGSKPLDIIRNAISKIRVKKTSLRTLVKTKAVQIQYSIVDKDILTLERRTPMPWEAGRSWLAGIERGISGFGYYLNGVFNKSRSGTGVQANNKIRNVSYKGVKYFNTLYNNFLRKFK